MLNHGVHNSAAAHRLPSRSQHSPPNTPEPKILVVSLNIHPGPKTGPHAPGPKEIFSVCLKQPDGWTPSKRVRQHALRSHQSSWPFSYYSRGIYSAADSPSIDHLDFCMPILRVGGERYSARRHRAACSEHPRPFRGPASQPHLHLVATVA